MKRERRPIAPPDCEAKRFALVTARFYPQLSEWLVDGARRALRDCKVRDADVELFEVPGCFEIPLCCRNLIEGGRYDALVALGVVIQGATPHFSYVAGECARGIMEIQLASGVPIGFGILTTLTQAQAEERADPQRGDKGYYAGLAAAVLAGIGKPGAHTTRLDPGAL